MPDGGPHTTPPLGTEATRGGDGEGCGSGLGDVLGSVGGWASPGIADSGTSTLAGLLFFSALMRAFSSFHCLNSSDRRCLRQLETTA